MANGLDNDQTATRRPGTLYDQHVSPDFPKGRPWHASIDKKSGFPVGVIQPKGWHAPWEPPQSAFVFSEDDPTRFRIDYETLITSRRLTHSEYDAQMRQAALVRGWDPTDPEKRSSLEALVGPSPLPVEVLVAAMQGNKRVLGLTDKPDPRVDAFLPKRDSRTERLFAGMPDFSDVDDDDLAGYGPGADADVLDHLLDIEESVDPQAVGGKRVKVKSAKRAA